MSTVIRCKCGRSYKLRDEAIGKTLKCKSCGKKLRIEPHPVGPNGNTGDDDFIDALSDAVAEEQVATTSVGDKQADIGPPRPKRRRSSDRKPSKSNQVTVRGISSQLVAVLVAALYFPCAFVISQIVESPGSQFPIALAIAILLAVAAAYAFFSTRCSLDRSENAGADKPAVRRVQYIAGYPARKQSIDVTQHAYLRITQDLDFRGLLVHTLAAVLALVIAIVMYVMSTVAARTGLHIADAAYRAASQDADNDRDSHVPPRQAQPLQRSEPPSNNHRVAPNSTSDDVHPSAQQPDTSAGSTTEDRVQSPFAKLNLAVGVVVAGFLFVPFFAEITSKVQKYSESGDLQDSSVYALFLRGEGFKPIKLGTKLTKKEVQKLGNQVANVTGVEPPEFHD